MDRTSGTGYVTVGGKRQFVDKNLSLGINGAQVNATFLTGVQESILSVVETAGLTPTDTDNTQLLAAIQTFISQQLAPNYVPSLSIGAVGHFKLFGSLIVNWIGNNGILTGPVYTAWDLAFPNSVLAVAAASWNPSPYVAVLDGPPTNFGCSVSNWALSGSRSTAFFNVIAIGH